MRLPHPPPFPTPSQTCSTLLSTGLDLALHELVGGKVLVAEVKLHLLHDRGLFLLRQLRRGRRYNETTPDGKRKEKPAQHHKKQKKSDGRTDGRNFFFRKRAQRGKKIRQHFRHEKHSTRTPPKAQGQLLLYNLADESWVATQLPSTCHVSLLLQGDGGRSASQCQSRRRLPERQGAELNGNKGTLKGLRSPNIFLAKITKAVKP